MPYTTTTLADLQTLMAQRWDQVVFWTDEEARLALNEALREWNLLTGRWRTTVLLDALAATPEIALPGLLTYAMRITTANGAAVHPTSIAELDLAEPSWRHHRAAAPILWAPLSLTQIVVWPCYAADALGALRCEGVMRTPVLTLPTDPVDLGEEIVDVVADFALHVAALKEAGDRWRATRPYFEAFLQAAADENSLLKQHQAYRRWAGLDRRRDYHPAAGAPNQLQGVVTAFSRHDQAETAND